MINNLEINNLKIRDLIYDDILEIFEWRNNYETRIMSINREKISFSNHQKWFYKTIKSDFIKIFIGTISQHKIGITKFDFNKLNGNCEVSINLNPKMRGMNFSTTFLSSSIDKYLISNKSQKLNAKIRKENKASIKIFKKCLFDISNEDEYFYYLERV